MANDSEEIATHMPKLREIAQQLNGSRRKSAQFNELCSLLKESTFAPGDPSFFSSQGNILMAYQHMVNETVRREFTDAVNVLGELDLYVALAKKMKIHQKLPVHYSFVQFTEGNTPSISASRFWNPFLPIETVVANSIEFNANGMNNMILTGPNTGGKSAMLKALMINILLAQTFGISASDQLTITPFTKLTCHMNITDDTGAGISLFKAEVQRAHELMEMVRKLGKNESAFIIIDEIFTGTSPDKAEELSYKFVRQLSDFPNVIFVSATHFKKLTSLEQETNGRCKNYHMSVITDDSGNVVKYTYTLAQGPSPVNNAAQIAHEEGIF
jgi:DNA mismatch repair ATPase MutS